MINIKNKKSALGILLACSSAVATGTFGVFLTFMAGWGLSDETVTLIGPAFMFLVFLCITLIQKGIKGLIVPQKLYYFTMIGLGGFVLYPLYNYTYVQVFNNLPIAIASLFHFSNAIVLVFLMRILFKQQISKEKIICCVLAIVGIILVLQVISFGTIAAHESVPITAMGIFWGVAVACSLAFVYTCDYFHMSRNIPVLTIQTYSCLCTTILLAVTSNPVNVINNFDAAILENGIIVLVVAICYCIVLAWSYYSITASYVYIDASMGALTFVLEPSVAAALGFIIFGQIMTPLQILGIIIAVGAIVYMQYSEGKKEEESALNLSDETVLE